MTTPSVTAEQRMWIALEERDFGVVLRVIREIAVRYPEMESVISELIPAIQSLQVSDPSEAFFRLAYETTYDSQIEDQLLAVAAKDLETTGQWFLAAMAWRACRTLRGRQRADALLLAHQIDESTIPPRIRKLSLEHYRKRIARNPHDSRAHERLAVTFLDNGERRLAYEQATQACSLDPTRADAAEVVARVLVADGRMEEARAWLNQASLTNPDRAWPLTSLAELEEPRDIQAALRYSSRALALQPVDARALILHTRLLQSGERWSELMDHLDARIRLTLHIGELSTLHFELGDILTHRLLAPLEGLQASQRGEWFQDRAAVIAYYWQSLSENESDPSVWEEVEEFFYVNEFWTDLAGLLIKKAEYCAGETLVDVMDELELVCHMKGNSLTTYHQALHHQIDRCRDTVVREKLTRRLQLAEAKTITPVENAISWPMIILYGLIGIMIVGSGTIALWLALTNGFLE